MAPYFFIISPYVLRKLHIMSKTIKFDFDPPVFQFLYTLYFCCVLIGVTILNIYLLSQHRTQHACVNMYIVGKKNPYMKLLLMKTKLYSLKTNLLNL